MSVDLRRTDIGVAQKLLDSPEIGTSLEKMSRIGVPQGVGVQGAAVGEGIAGEHPTGVAGRHKKHCKCAKHRPLLLATHQVSDEELALGETPVW